jgi:hypothetical protein
MKAKTFDANFDQGKDVTDALDLAKTHRPLQGAKEGQRRLTRMDGRIVRQRGASARRNAAVDYQAMAG